MNAFILLQQMLVLGAMMAVGFFVYRIGWLDDHSVNSLTALVVRVFNPIMIFNSSVGKNTGENPELLTQNLILALLYFMIVIAAGYLYVRIRKFDRREGNMYIMLTTFSNVGFMGIPVVRALYGEEYVIYIVFYLLFFNIIAYTLGISLAYGMKGESESFRPGMLLNTGLITCVICLILFFLRVPMSAPVETFCFYMGNVATPLSMIVIGVSLAQADWRELFLNVTRWRFVAFKMLLLPIVCSLVFRFFPFDPILKAIFILLLSMPDATLSGMLATVYGGDGSDCNKTIVVTTLVSVLTIPIVALF